MMNLKELVKNRAYELGADLVGFGDIGRCGNAPLMMSPQGLYPEAKTIIVMAIHHPDACVELGGERHPQEIGPYSVQYTMNTRLDEMSYRMATFLEKSGFGAVPIVSSNIWRYNKYKSLDAVFAPDVSHIYMAVVAGLADIGYSGLAITPEYGARNRFVTVITDAGIDPDPLIPPGTVCDRCMLCREHCPAEALSKEIDGDKELQIGEYAYRFPNKNLWRCAWGEHFGLDLDLDIPDVVNEDVILDAVKEHGLRGGEMGQCLKFCLPRDRRSADRAYSRAPVRKSWISCDESLEPRSAVDRLIARAYSRGADGITVHSCDELQLYGVNLGDQLPGAKSAVTVMVEEPADPVRDRTFRSAAVQLVDSICFDLTRALEDIGFRSLMTVRRTAGRDQAVSAPELSQRIIAATCHGRTRGWVANTVLTRKTVPSRSFKAVRETLNLDAGVDQPDITAALRDWALSLGADLFGVAPVERVNALAEQVKPVFDGQEILVAADKSMHFFPCEPEITVAKREVLAPSDYIADARSVVVFGLRLHRQVVRRAACPPAEAVGPYAFQTYVTSWIGSVIGLRIVKWLEQLGWRGVIATDLLNTASVTAGPRGPQPDLYSNRFAALAAGLGYLTVSGHLATPQFGVRQRLVAVVTNAPLQASPLYRPASSEYRCAQCDRTCMTSCPSGAITRDEMTVRCDGVAYRFNLIDNKRCDWSKRYALLGDSGFKYLGSPLDAQPDESVSAEALADALRRHDPIKRHLPAVAEPCIIKCPYGTGR